MKRFLCSVFLMPLAATSAVAGVGNPPTNEMLVFISAFAAGEEGAICAYRLQLETGQLQALQRTEDVEFPFFLATSPHGRFLFSIHAPGQFGGEKHEQVAAYEIVGKTGQLKLLNRQSARGSAACYLAVDATGQTLVLANYATGSVAAFPIQQDGWLGEATSFLQHTGSSVDAGRQEGPHAHCAVISPDNRFVLVADLGLDQLLSYQLDSQRATLAPNRQPFVRTSPGAGPRHLTFHPDGKHVYVINELQNSVTLFDYDPGSGFLIQRQTIPTLPADFTGTSHCADVKITPNGRFLYGTNRGHDSLAAYGVDQEGRLTLLGIFPSGGKGPQNLAITPGGELLLCANMPGNNVVVFRIDPQTGGLTSVGQPTTIPSPSCILLQP